MGIAWRMWVTLAAVVVPLSSACGSEITDDRTTLTPLHGTITPELLASSGGRPRDNAAPAETAAPATWSSAGVIDGQTLVLVSDGRSVRVRLAGLLAPTGEDCLAELATDSLRFIVSGRDELSLDARGAERGDGVQPGYVENVDGDDLGAVMIRLGLAEVDDSTVDGDRRDVYEAEFEAAQDEAVGLWADDACDDDN